jgi:hypothetical protein
MFLIVTVLNGQRRKDSEVVAMRSTYVITRRGMLLFAAASGIESLLYGDDSEFWNKKEPSSWSADEVDRLITKSPWAKEVGGSTSRPGRGGNAGGGSGGRGGMGGGGRGIGIGIPGIGGMGIPGAGGGGRRGGGRRDNPDGGGAAPVQFNGVVRWESAQPILDAMKTPLPEAFADRYVISVSGIPLSGNERRPDEEISDAAARKASDDAIDRIKNLTELVKKGASALQPGVVEQNAISVGPGTTLLFGFSKELLALSPHDDEVTFSTRIGTIPVKVKFNLKKMIYRKTLAV